MLLGIVALAGTALLLSGCEPFCSGAEVEVVTVALLEEEINPCKDHAVADYLVQIERDEQEFEQRIPCGELLDGSEVVVWNGGFEPEEVPPGLYEVAVFARTQKGTIVAARYASLEVEPEVCTHCEVAFGVDDFEDDSGCSIAPGRSGTAARRSWIIFAVIAGLALIGRGRIEGC